LVDRAGKVVLYASIRNEVRTDGIFSRIKRIGKQVFFPRISGASIEFVAVEKWSELGPGKWGVPEPRSGVPGALEGVDLVVVPGVAFDERGCRLGFGKGYFDKALSNYRGIKVGLAYDFQVLRRIPDEEGDLYCDYIFTESRTIPANEPCRG
jgi:5-formyltetrahydrofolate cyclo-ligase